MTVPPKLLLCLLAALCLAARVQGEAGGEEESAAATSVAEEQYLEAIGIRDKPGPSLKELKRAVALLRSAAGVESLGVARGGENATAGGSGGGLTASQVDLVLRSDEEVYLPALRELMYVYRSGDGVAQNHAVAHRLLQQLAALGDGDSQTDLGLTLALGLEPLGPNSRDQLFRFVAPDLPAALTHYFFGAAAGDSMAQMVLGYRHMQGLGVPKSCSSSVLYYAPVAQRVLDMARQREGLPQVRKVRLSHKTAHARQRSSEQEVLHYQWFADFGNVDAARAVAHMLTHGSFRDYDQAMYYLKQAAAAGDADAMAHLGHIYANGIAVKQSNDSALAWFWKAAEKGHPSGLFGLGFMYLSGRGVARNNNKALKYFKQAAEAPAGMWAGQGDAYFYLGLMHLNGWATKPDKATAAQLFEAASNAGNLLASYNLAMLHLRGATAERSPCEAAAALLKKVAERGFPVLQEAGEDFQAGEYEWALLGYLKAAEMGMELGQSNAAWMLSEGYGYEGPGAGAVALMLYRRAAEQGNMDALLALGDGYWYGKGVGRDWARAAQLYGEASKHRIGQALFNLGYMHEFGAGLPPDLHLAKRFYDSALEAQPEAQLAVTLALAWLRLHGWWQERVQPKLPAAWAAAAAGLFTVSEPDYQLAPQHGGRRTLWGAVREALTLDAVFEKLDAALDFEEGFDVTIMSGLAALLLLVMWRRQTLRARQARFFPQAPPAAMPAAQQAQQPSGEQQQAQQAQQPMGGLEAAAAGGPILGEGRQQWGEQQRQQQQQQQQPQGAQGSSAGVEQQQ